MSGPVIAPGPINPAEETVMVLVSTPFSGLDSSVGRRQVLRSLAGLAAGAAALSALGVSRANAQSATFPIRIDATQLLYRSFRIPGQTLDWISGQIVQTLHLPAGQYSFQVGSGYFADFTFSVTAQGAVDYDHTFDTFLDGRGSGTLVIAGFPVTLDARYLSGAGILLVIPATADDFIAYKQCRMVPATGYSVQQGSGQVADFTFRLGLDGRFSYNVAYDVAHGGFLSGNGTSTLEFQGYPLLVDARASGGTGLTLQPVASMPFSLTSVQYAALLPAANYWLQVRSGVVSSARFGLAVDGSVGVDSSQASLLRVDSFHGLKRLTALGPLN
jgi:hypothetical protein